MRKVSMTTRRELVEAVGERYRSSDREHKGRVLDEFVSVTGYHRRHAMRLLRSPSAAREKTRPARQIYDEAVRTTLIVLWETSDRLCGKRLKPLVPILIEAMEGHGHLSLDPAVRGFVARTRLGANGPRPAGLFMQHGRSPGVQVGPCGSGI